MDEMLARIISCIGNKHGAQKALAEHLGIHPNVITNWKNGTNKSYRGYINEIADFYGVSADFLLTGEQKEKPPVNDERFLPLAERREALSKAGIHILLDADAKVTEEQLDDIISFIEIQQRRNGR